MRHCSSFLAFCELSLLGWGKNIHSAFWEFCHQQLHNYHAFFCHPVNEPVTALSFRCTAIFPFLNSWPFIFGSYFLLKKTNKKYSCLRMIRNTKLFHLVFTCFWVWILISQISSNMGTYIYICTYTYKSLNHLG